MASELSYRAVWNFAHTLQRISRKARDEFLHELSAVDFSDQERAEQAIRVIAWKIHDKYGKGASELAAQWYDYCHQLQIGRGYTSGIPEGGKTRYGLDSDIKDAFIRRANGDIADDDELAKMLGGIMTNQIHRTARTTIMDNLVKEQQELDERGTVLTSAITGKQIKLGYSRVPTGDACAFCVLLASRSYYPLTQLYTTESKAMFKGNGEKFHAHCKCTIVPFAETGDIPGYAEDLDKYNSQYREADDMWKKYSKNPQSVPEELAAQIESARTAHLQKEREDPDNTPGWQRLNEELIIMRYLNPGLK